MSVHRLGALFVLLAVVLAASSPAQADQMGEKGKVDWVDGVVLGYGYGTTR